MLPSTYTSQESDGQHLHIEFQMRRQQLEVLESLRRFNVLVAHRRYGKTVLAIWVLIVKALQCPLHRPQVHYYCPTYAQAKRVAWGYLKDFCSTLPGTEFNESELRAILASGAIIQLGSADNPDASRGIYSDFVVLDEPAQMPERFWSEVLRPALSDRKGGCLMIGTPAGRHGLFYDSYQAAPEQADWWRGMYKASETGILEDAELHSAARAMTKAEYAQEYECSFDAAIRGAYWAEAMDQADKAGRICPIPYEPGKLVHVCMDLGVNDATACWFFQVDGRAIRMIDHQEYTNSGLPDIVADWRRKPYSYGKVIAPFDIEVQSLSTGLTRKQTLQSLGVDVVVAPQLPVIDGIEAARQLIARISFDAVKCSHGIECLRQYRSDWDDKQGVLRLRPLHNWASHSADSLRYLAATGTDILEGSWGDIDYSRMDRGLVV